VAVDTTAVAKPEALVVAAAVTWAAVVDLAAAILAASVVVAAVTLAASVAVAVAVTWAAVAVVATGKLLRLPRATKKARLLRQAGLFRCVNNKRIPIL
jgi:hypothetical protein